MTTHATCMLTHAALLMIQGRLHADTLSAYHPYADSCCPHDACLRHDDSCRMYAAACRMCADTCRLHAASYAA
eukprot:4478188-Pyramimonas_sp.AAC.1